MSRNTGLNNSSLKQQNRGLLLKLIATNQCNTRVDLAKASQLTKMSVTNIVSEFMDNGLVEEHPIADTTKMQDRIGVGRNPILLEISSQAPTVMGVLINREFCSSVLCDLKLKILKQETIKAEEWDKDSLVQAVFDLIERVKKGSKHVVGIGIGSIGPLDLENGIILNPPNFYGIQNVPIVELVKENFGIPTYLDNQYNCAALAEKYYGFGARYQDFIFLGITNGIGSGIISGGSLYRNASGLASEIGHISIDYQGNPCDCGNRGCLETYASIHIIEKRLRDATGRSLSFEEFCECCNEKEVDEILADMMEKISFGLVSAVNMLSPQAIILGHEGVFLPDKYLSMLQSQINERKISRNYAYTDVIRPYFGSTSHLVGSACLIMNEMFRGKILFDEKDIKI